MSAFLRSRTCLSWVLGALLLLQAGCGGGDGIGSGGTGITARSSLITGTVTKGPVSNATVVAYALTNGQRGTPIGSALTDAEGNFSMAVGSYQGPMMLEARAGTYRDEATGSLMTLDNGDVLTAAIASPAVFGPGPSEIQVTPVTSMAQARAQRMAGGMTQANIAAANAAIGDYFSITDILHVPPMNPLVPRAAEGASMDSRNYGMALAGMSQFALTVGATNSAAVVTSLVNDAADGVMDGRNGADPVRVTVGGFVGSTALPGNAGSVALAVAMVRFAASTSNVSGLTGNDIAALAQRISGSGGKF